MRTLITGGAGYIGSHALLEVLAAGHDAHVLDDFSTASPEALRRVRRLAGRGFGVTRADLRDRAAVAAAVAAFRPDAVLHLAGLKVPGASVTRPLDYFDVNVGGLVVLLRALAATSCRRLVFSSSCSVYGEPLRLPLDEAHPRRPGHPYARTKLQCEDILSDHAAADPGWSVALLRYFNPVGAHPSGLIGDDPLGIPQSLMPLLTRVAVGRQPALTVWGDDYPTADGTGVRDYVHVVDVARAHVAALAWTGAARGCEAINLGTGRGTSVLELVAAFAAATGRPVPVRVGPRRPGDVAAAYACAAKAERLLGWRAAHGLAEMCRSAWRWQSENPIGYADAAAALEAD